MKRTTAFLIGFLFMLPFFAFGQGSVPLVPCEGPDCKFASLVELADRIMDFLMFTVAVPIATILFMYAGFLYVSAGANPNNVKRATSIFQNVFWGFIIALSAWLIVNFVTTMLLEPGFLDQ